MKKKSIITVILAGVLAFAIGGVATWFVMDSQMGQIKNNLESQQQSTDRLVLDLKKQVDELNGASDNDLVGKECGGEEDKKCPTGYYCKPLYKCKDSKCLGSVGECVKQNDETADWKTYNGKEFSFKYPSNIKINKEWENGGVEIGTDYPFNYELEDAYSFEVYIGSYLGDDFGHQTAGSLQKTENITLGNITGKKTTWIKDDNKEFDINFDKTDKSYQIRFTTTSGSKYDKIFNLIISTFKLNS